MGLKIPASTFSLCFVLFCFSSDRCLCLSLSSICVCSSAAVFLFQALIQMMMWGPMSIQLLSLLIPAWHLGSPIHILGLACNPELVDVR